MINDFRKKNFFLSNFFNSEITIGDHTFRNGEAAFHSFKEPGREYIFIDLDASEAKSAGRRVHLRRDWEEVKDDCMYQVVKAKFEQNPRLAELLLATGEEHLEEGNTWGDKYWGTVKGIGQNKLGQILMRVRAELK